MAKSKYNAKTFPKLAKGLARKGYTDSQIAIKLGISKATFYSYTKLYPEFAQALAEGKAPVNVDVEDSVLKRATGYEYTETKVIANAEGKVLKKEVTVKHIPANVDAAKFWLINRDPAHWKLKQEITMELEKLSDEDLNALAKRLIQGEL